MSDRNTSKQDVPAAEDIAALLSTSVGEPPADIDARVLQRARAVTSEAPTVQSSVLRPWMKVVPVAAMLVIAVGVTLQMQTPEGLSTASVDVESAADTLNDSQDIEQASEASIALMESDTLSQSKSPPQAPALQSRSAVLAMDAVAGGAGSSDMDPRLRIANVLDLLSRNETEQARDDVQLMMSDFEELDLRALLPDDTDEPILSEFLNLLDSLETHDIPSTPAPQADQ